jgi:hypothetical protein
MKAGIYISDGVPIWHDFHFASADMIVKMNMTIFSGGFV